MGRKNRLSLVLINNGDMSDDLASSSISTENLDNIGLILEWNGTGISGTIQIQVQNKSSAWSTLDFGTPITLSTDAGIDNISINQIPFDNLRVLYLASSGIGTLTVTLGAKVVGA